MFKKFLSAIFISAISFWLIPFSGISFAAEEQKELDTGYITKLQHEISADISHLRESIEKELAGTNLTSSDIAKRSKEIAALVETASDDMASWGYTDEQKELRSRVLSELGVAYSAYGALMESSLNNLGPEESIDISSLGTIASPDINVSYSLRKEISKVSKGLDVQLFTLQSKLKGLKAYLAAAIKLDKELKEAEEGGKALDLPRTHVLKIELAKLNVALSRLQVRRQKAAFDASVSNILRLRRRLEDVRSKLIFPREVLDENLAKIQEKIHKLTDEMTEAHQALDSANASLIKARSVLGSADINVLTDASVAYRARLARVSYWEYMVSLIDDEIAINRNMQQAWRDRYKLFHDEASGEEIWKIREETQTRIEELKRQLEAVRTHETEIINQASMLQSMASNEELPSTLRQNIIRAAENYRKIVVDIFDRYKSVIPDAIALEQRLLTEANDSMSAIRIAEKVSNFSYETVMGFLNTELWQGDGYSVTVSKLIIALVVFISSFFLSSWWSKWIKKRMINRFKASITAANAVQRIAFYILWVAFALIALNIVKIPLTAFTFMGGAFAVGIGFGMQNIFNNLISGFIVIFSRPFKVNDIIEVSGTQGTVEDIGSRATMIKTWDGFDVLLPNRYFLENTVTNWTKTDLKKREILKIGVSYDADTREVEKILLDVAQSHSKVLKDPAPSVLFTDFGDNALEFELRFWIELKVSSGPKVASDMRHHITSVFRREGINIPYPQRDIHIINDDGQKIISEEKSDSPQP